MGSFFQALKAGLKGGWEAATEGDHPQRYTVGGRAVRCPHCSNETFIVGKALLNTKGREFLNMAWADAYATTMVCGECGNIQWFAQEPQMA
jgi:ribosomal protein S27E